MSFYVFASCPRHQNISTPSPKDHVTGYAAKQSAQKRQAALARFLRVNDILEVSQKNLPESTLERRTGKPDSLTNINKLIGLRKAPGKHQKSTRKAPEITKKHQKSTRKAPGKHQESTRNHQKAPEKHQESEFQKPSLKPEALTERATSRVTLDASICS